MNISAGQNVRFEGITGLAVCPHGHRDSPSETRSWINVIVGPGTTFLIPKVRRK